MKRSTGFLSLLVACTFMLAACAEQTDTETGSMDTPDMSADTAMSPMPSDTSSMGASDVTLSGTLTALQGGITQMPMNAAISNIEGWQQRLENSSAQGASDIASTLGELKSALQASSIDGQEVGDLLSQLGDQTTQAAGNVQGQQASQLQRLGSTLTSAGEQLTGGGM